MRVNRPQTVSPEQFLAQTEQVVLAEREKYNSLHEGYGRIAVIMQTLATDCAPIIPDRKRIRQGVDIVAAAIVKTLSDVYDSVTVGYVTRMILAEYKTAREKHAKMSSLYEGWAVLQEEVDEFWDEVKKKSDRRVATTILREGVQVGAMALAIAVELT